MPRRTLPRSRHQAYSVERLESRMLLAATLGRGILAIRGTAANDVIEVRRSADETNVLQVVENGAVTFSRALTAIRQIRIHAGAGNDEISVNQDNGAITTPTTIKGGRGDDLMRGGGGTNRIDGGLGRDAFHPGGGRDRVTSATRVDRLSRLGTQEAFRDYLANAARTRGGRGAVADGSEAMAWSVSAGYSQTNTQVAGVDEGDIIENDGRHLFILSRAELLIVDAQDAAVPVVASRTKIDGSPLAEYLHQGRLTVLSSVWTPADAAGHPGIMPLLGARHAGQVQVTVYDVANPAEPQLISSTRIDGGYVDSRMVHGRLALVVQNDLLAGSWDYAPVIMPAVMPEGRPAFVAPPGSAAALAKRVRQTPIARMLPTWTTTVVQADGSSTTSPPQLVSRPRDVLSPAVGAEANLTSVVLIDVHAATPGITGATSVIGGYASTLHMNAEELYIFSPRWESIHGERTDVRRFDITGAAPRFVASGSFDGHLLNQFSADEHGDFLRVAVTLTTHEPAPDDAAASAGPADMAVSLPFRPWTTNRSNALYVLATEGDTLAVVGSVENIAPGESIMSARFVGDTAYMVTFEQVDPLYVIDLSTPTTPRIAGELKVPGFSRFLQPLDDGFLLGIGRDADADTGMTRGLKVSLFDVRDASAPTEVSTFLIEQPRQGWSWSGAEWDHHALGFFPELDAIALPVQSVTWTDDPTTGLSTGQMLSGVVVLDVDPVAGITELGTVAHDSHLLRTARIGSTLYSVADLDLKAVDVVSGGLSPRGTVILQQPDRGEAT